MDPSSTTITENTEKPNYRLCNLQQIYLALSWYGSMFITIVIIKIFENYDNI